MDKNKSLCIILLFLDNKKKYFLIKKTMGQLIDFGGKNLKRVKQEPKSDDLISILPRLKALKGEIIVIKINNEVIANDILLQSVIKEIVTLKCMGTIVIIVADSDNKVAKYYDENEGIKDPFINSKFVSTNGITDVLEVLIKHDSVKKIVNIIKKYNVMSLAISGNDLDIILPDNVVNKNIETFSFASKQLYGGLEQKNKKYSIDNLNELLKTDLIPIIIPTFKDAQNNEYLLESSEFGMYVAKYTNALKYVVLYTNNKQVPTSCIYGIERFTKIVKTGKFSGNTLRFLGTAIEAIKNGIQGVHIIDCETTSLLEEFCFGNVEGLFLYDDTLNQL